MQNLTLVIGTHFFRIQESTGSGQEVPNSEITSDDDSVDGDMVDKDIEERDANRAQA